MLLQQCFVPGLAIHSYLVGDERSGEAAVIDPTRDVDRYLFEARANGLHIRHILETHVHADFVSGSRELKARLDEGATIHCSGHGGDEWTPPYADTIVSTGDAVQLGTVRLEALHTPGHTPEHLSWLLYDHTRSADIPWVAFTGDFLFVGDVGRPDLLGDEARQQLAHALYQSVFERLPGIPDITEVFPGHGAGSLCGKAIGSRPSSTVGYERLFNKALAARDETEWVTALLADMPLAPPYFQRMKQINREGPPLIGATLPGQRRWSATHVYEQTCEHCLVVDVRSKEAFAAAHIPNAINIPFGPNLSTWAGWLLPYDHPTLLVLDDAANLAAATTHLVRVGFDDVRGYLEGGIDTWATSGFPISTLSTLSVHQLRAQLESRARPTIVDVRTESEWRSGHIDGAVHIHGGTLKDHFSQVPREHPVAVICGSGYRASIAASFLKREGYESVSNVMGGMSAWYAAKLPTVT